MIIEWNDKEVMTAINKAVAGDSKEAAEYVAKVARQTRLFKDRSGTARGSIRVAKSKFKNGGYIVLAGGKGLWGDAWYVPKIELGHKGVPARPFMRRAKKQSMRKIRQIFKSK